MAKQIIGRHNVCAAKEYTTSQGEVKTQWVPVGTSVTFDDGSYLININALPMGNWWDGVLQGFKQEPRDQQGTAGRRHPPPEAISNHSTAKHRRGIDRLPRHPSQLLSHRTKKAHFKR